MYYTKSLTDDSPIENGIIHIYEGGDNAICGKRIELNGRWFIAPYIGIYEKYKVTCKKCLKLEEGGK